jgi:hypothetical protein
MKQLPAMTRAAAVRNRLGGLLVALALAGSIAACSETPATPGSGSGGAPAGSGGATGTGGAPTCTHPEVVNGHQVAPCGYYVEGNQIYKYDGQVHMFRGLARPSMEWVAAGEMVGDADFDRMASWRPNVIRFSLNQDFYLPGAARSSASYPQLIAQWVRKVKERGMDVILDLHWTDRGNLAITQAQQDNNGNPLALMKMADQNSITFWTMVANQFKGDGRVIFELFNEPHDISWSVWRNGGTVDGWQAAGMQQLYEAVRSTGAHNLVLIGGLDYAFDLSGVGANRITGYNIAYVSHPYGHFNNKQVGNFDAAFGTLSQSDPIILTEFGNNNCNAQYYTDVISYAAPRRIGWTAWAWYPQGCTFPSLINDWNGTPSTTGQVIRNALMSN